MVEDAAYEADRDLQWEEAQTEIENEKCPCGHKRSQHEMEEGHCLRCECPQFGEPTESWEQHTEVNVGDGPGGFRIYE